jgi:AcrR family transcriptional regulator
LFCPLFFDYGTATAPRGAGRLGHWRTTVYGDLFDASAAFTEQQGDKLAVRAEKKARTRNRLIDSALAIIGVGANFASISLREVAKTAGVVPTSFYRHFGDMEELGLAIVDELGLNLRRLMRGSFDAKESLDDIIQHCTEAYFDYVQDNANLLQFVNQSRTGGTEALQNAIRNELQFLSGRIAIELSVLLPESNAQDRDIIGRLVVSTLMENTTNLLAIPSESSSLREELKQCTVDQIHIIMLGAKQWRSGQES